MISQTVNERVNLETEDLQLRIAYMGTGDSDYLLNELPSKYIVDKHSTLEQLLDYLNDRSIITLPDIILIETDPKGECFDFIEDIKKKPLWRELIIVLISRERKKEWKARALKLKIHDYYILPFPTDHLLERLDFLIKFKLIRPQLSALEEADITYKLPAGKRLFDVLISAGAILVLSPVYILTALIIALTSKGPVIYKSKRVGTGYNIFHFYKFRSMYVDADKSLDKVSQLNRYNSNGADPKSQAIFVKIKDDPRVTRFGHFIRKTSIDELPQLFNVLNGDMSLVGNRPLPLYEAEMLTSNEWSMRFMGPAGVTGLWQIKSRGKRDISERERKKFDNVKTFLLV
jgi:lipopolysaccharide/colanic/teichoic acid biosynthesis glycosyltransferase